MARNRFGFEERHRRTRLWLAFACDRCRTSPSAISTVERCRVAAGRGATCAPPVSTVEPGLLPSWCLVDREMCSVGRTVITGRRRWLAWQSLESRSLPCTYLQILRGSPHLPHLEDLDGLDTRVLAPAAG